MRNINLDNAKVHGGGGDGGMAPGEHIYYDNIDDAYVIAVINTRRIAWTPERGSGSPS